MKTEKLTYAKKEVIKCVCNSSSVTIVVCCYEVIQQVVLTLKRLVKSSSLALSSLL